MGYCLLQPSHHCGKPLRGNKQSIHSICLYANMSQQLLLSFLEMFVTVFNRLRGNEPVHGATSNLDLSGHVQA